MEGDRAHCHLEGTEKIHVSTGRCRMCQYTVL